ncbi:macrophage mannose receptor 1-like 9 [Homarus americanus]|uniref:Macrophage mannose receptor 1-like 9 n=1 Tax=Homarus americanus TaxID=6706 RepID=A0A8J5JGL8_HOMAM|nr:macrophage mannose receptor 1-like 9 [Homarus americanus]
MEEWGTLQKMKTLWSTTKRHRYQHYMRKICEIMLKFLFHACGVLLAQCPDGWQLWEGTNQCYILLTRPDTNTFDDSITLCRVRGGDLLSIPDKATKNWLRKILSATQLEGQDAYTWVGARLVNDSWVWVDTEEPVDNEMLPWDDGSDGKCAAFTTSSTLIKLSCSLRLNLVCHRPLGVPEACDHSKGWNQIGDFCYKSSGDTASWAVGRRGCVEQEANLLTITGGQEQQHAYDFALSLHDKVWIGLAETKHPGEWRWSDGTKVNFTHWSHAQPVSLGGFGAAVVNNVDIDGRWEVERVTDNYHYICKKKTGGCVAGWEEFAGACYYFITGNDDFLVWEDAKASCEDIGASLVVLETQDEDIFIRGHIPETESIWLGLYSKPKEEFYWMNGATIASYNFSFMKQEDTRIALSSNSSKCVFFQVSVWDKGLQKNSSWVPVDCQEAKFYACEVPAGTSLSLAPPSVDVHCPRGWLKYQGHCYLPSYQQVTWSEARESCEEFGADLTSVLTWQEQDFIHNQQAASGWIGLQQKLSDRNWEWSDSSPVSITNWENELPCGPGWTENPLTGECYYLVLEELTFHDASQHCRHHLQQQEIEKGSDDIPHLVSLTTIQEQLFVSSQVVNQHIGQTSLWLGLRNDYMDGNRWLDGSPVVYFNWDSRAPIGPLTDFCIEMYTGSGKWNDVSCEQRLIFICEKKAKKYTPPQTLPPPPEAQCPGGWRSWNHHCYYFSSDPVSWHQARAWCQDYLGSDLVSVTSKAENSFILGEVFRAKQDVWLGLYADGNTRSWSWVDGSNINRYHNWLGSHSATHGQCGELRADGTLLEGFWVPASCNTEKVFICKTTTDSLIPKIGGNTWLGLTYDLLTSTWVWVDGRKNDYTNWNIGEPLHEGEDRCVELLSAQGKWTSLLCDNSRTFVCQLRAAHSISCEDGWIPFNDYCYWYSGSGNASTTLTFNDAHDNCRSRDASLASIHSDPENQLAFSLLDKYDPQDVFLGLSDDGHQEQLSWLDGSSLSYTNWHQFNSNREYSRNDYDITTPSTPPPTAPVWPCVGDWMLINDRCYKVFLETTTWARGEALCLSYSGHLTSVGSRGEEDNIKRVLEMTLLEQTHPLIWVGLHLDGESGHVWSDGTAVQYVRWGIEQPDSHRGQLRCGTAYTSTLMLADADCYTFLPFICEAPQGMKHPTSPLTKSPDVLCDGDTSWLLFGDQCYRFFSASYDNPETWRSSRLRCREQGGELASIHTNEENYWILSKILGLSDEMVWVGGRSVLDSGYQWLDNTTFDFDNWARGEPNNILGQEDCIVLYSQQEGRWGDRSCDTLAGSICKRRHGTNPSTPAVTTATPLGHCLQGWLHSGSKCLKFSKEKKTFDGAVEACTSPSKLASIHSPQEQAFLTAVLGDLGTNVWLGLRNNQSFHWKDNTSVTYTSWAPGEPNGIDGEEGCVEASHVTGLWSDVPCTSTRGYVCMVDTDSHLMTEAPYTTCASPFSLYIAYNGACYHPHSTYKTWKEAETTCKDEGAHLVSVSEPTEGAFLWMLAKNHNFTQTWLGLHYSYDNSRFLWSDSTPTTYTNWGMSQPNTSLTNHACVWLNSMGGLWYSQLCDDLRPFVCKYKNGKVFPKTDKMWLKNGMMWPKKVSVISHDPPATGRCPDARWLDLGNGFCYLVSQYKQPWDEARRTCVLENSNLASMHSEAEMIAVTVAIHGITDPLWIGLVKEEHGYGWSDRSGVDYVNWGVDEPGGGTDEGCVLVYTQTGSWSDTHCSTAAHYLCKTLKIQMKEVTNPPVPGPFTPQSPTTPPGPESDKDSVDLHRTYRTASLNSSSTIN